VAGEDGEPWFVANDVCKVLGISNSRDALNRLDDDEKADVGITDGTQKRLFSIVNESGLYHLTITSRKPFAKRFRKWLTSEVAPDIRKHGVYTTGNFVEKALADPASMIQVLQQPKKTGRRI